MAKCGEDVGQRTARFIPVVGTFIDRHYDRISDSEFYEMLGIDVAATALPTFKFIKGFKNTAKAHLVGNLREAIYHSGSFNTALKQHTILAFEEAGILTKEGKLTEKAIKEAKGIMSFNELKNESLKEALLKINKNGDWWKCKTESIRIIGEQPAEIHFYMDTKTKHVYLKYDFKIKTNNDAGVGLFKPFKKDIVGK